MILSYLIQTSIAMIGFVVIAIYQVVKLRRPNKHTPLTDQKGRFWLSSSSSASNTSTSYHLRNFYLFLSDFHKLQCYYSITLQTASFIALYGPPSTKRSIKNPFDEAFLLLVSANGIIPIAITFHSLNLCNRVTLYNSVLTILSVALGSYTGIDIVRLLSKPYDNDERTRLSNSGWPAATSGLAPEYICGRRYEIKYPKKLKPEKVFLVGTVLCDLIIVCVIASYLFPSFPRINVYPKLKGRLKFKGRSSLSGRTIKLMSRMVHLATASMLVWCVAMEFFFFYQILVPQYDRIVDFDDWGFGQIVGIAIWAAVLVDFVSHEIASLRGSGD